MINLLSPDTKKQLRSAHKNVTLVRYIAILILAAIFLALACGASYIFLTNNKVTSEKLETDTSSSYVQTEQKLDGIITSLSNAKNILDQQVPYSKIITEIAAALPGGIMLDKLTINGAEIGSPITIKAHATSDESANQIGTNLANSKLLSSFNLLPSTTGENGNSKYPVEISFSILIRKGVSS